MQRNEGSGGAMLTFQQVKGLMASSSSSDDVGGGLGGQSHHDPRRPVFRRRAE
jgi:hypothetical protein